MSLVNDERKAKGLGLLVLVAFVAIGVASSIIKGGPQPQQRLQPDVAAKPLPNAMTSAPASSPVTKVTTAPAQKPGLVVSEKRGIGGVIGCFKLNKDVVQHTHRTEWVSTAQGLVLKTLADGETGRIFDLNDPDECRGHIANGTTVVMQKFWGTAACVVPEGASPPCMWVMMSKLTFPSDYQFPKVPDFPK